MSVKCSGVRTAGPVTVMERREISRISGGEKDAEETSTGKPSVLQTVRSPWAVQKGSRWAQSVLVAPEDRTHPALPCPAMHRAVRAMRVCKALPGSLLHGPPRATDASQGSSAQLENICLPPHPHFMPEPQIPLTLSLVLVRVWRSRGWAELGTAPK